jgi:hypothetical protein
MNAGGGGIASQESLPAATGIIQDFRPGAILAGRFIRTGPVARPSAPAAPSKMSKGPTKMSGSAGLFLYNQFIIKRLHVGTNQALEMAS